MTENTDATATQAAKELCDLIYAHHVIKYDPAAAQRCAEQALEDFAQHRTRSTADVEAHACNCGCNGDPFICIGATTEVTFQQRVQPWLMECFGAMIAGNRKERNHRFLEEALELVQACGCTASEAHQLVDYTFGRPVGEPAQEVGGVMVTLAALCLANDLDMHANGETELARIWTKVEKIRAKQAAKPKHSPLPEVSSKTTDTGGAAREHAMPGDPPDICQTALQWYLNFNFSYPHSVRESNIAVEAFKDGIRAALQMPPVSLDVGRYKQALQAIQTAVVEGRVCDDVAWFSNIETLYDFIEDVLKPSQPAVVADMFPATSTDD